MLVTVRREVTVVVEQTATVEVPDPGWLDTPDGQDFLDGVEVVERPLDYVDATRWVAADVSQVPS